MAKVKAPPFPVFVQRLRTALTDTLKDSGIKAEVWAEPVPTTRLYRVWVTAPKFKSLKHSERQSLVWRIAESALPPDEQMRISMIVTMTPQEAQGG
jgi:hypothetical protein